MVCSPYRLQVAAFISTQTFVKLSPFLLLPLVLVVGGCVSQEPQHPLGRAAIRTKGEPDVFQVKDDDAQMDQATRQARKTVGKFIAALSSPTPSQHGFAVKKLFVKDGEGEHIWLTDIHYSHGRFHGIVDNKPTVIKGLKVGDRHSVNPDEVSDWLYVENGHLVGGYTLRVLASELSPEQRAAFEKEAKFTIGR